ncbi:MAG: pantetheine-phosphate adenylyltransferase [Candidatus Hodarchaeales archaeon]
MTKFHLAGIGGTFDRLHSGHKLLFEIAAFYADILKVGLIDSSYFKEKPKEEQSLIQNYNIRYSNLKDYGINFLKRKLVIFRVKHVGEDRKIAVEQQLDALVVSPETYTGALEINKKREERGKKRVSIIISPFVLSQNGIRESSTRLRKEKNAQ